MPIEKRPFGRSGHQSTVTLFGAAGLKNVSQAVADRTLEVLLRHGVNHIDVAPRYGDAELRIGPWMREHRDDFFLATKVDQRTRAGAAEQIRRSLDRLQTDRLDLVQIHSLAHPLEWETVMGPDGALEALVEARDEGLVGHIGVTGHGWTIAAMHRRSLERFDFDSVLMPFNYPMYATPRYREDFDAVVSVCEERNVAVQTIKGIARGPWATTAENRNTWYQPLEDPADIEMAVHWVLGHPGVFLNTVGDVDLLPVVLDAAARYERRPGDDEMQAMVERQTMTPLFGIGT